MFKDIAAFFGYDLVDKYSNDFSELVQCDEIFSNLIDTLPKNQARFISKVQAHVTKEARHEDNKYVVIKFNKSIQIRLFADGTWRFHKR